MTIGFRSAGLALLWGAATVSTVFICPAIAGADPDQASDQQQCADEQDPQAMQACEAAAAAAAANQAINGAQKAADAAGQAGQQAGDGAAKAGDTARNNGIDLSDKDCWVLNGVPMMFPQYAATPRGPGDVQGWCPDVYHLKPH